MASVLPTWGGTNSAWGLVAKIGPSKPTARDLKELNSRSGGPHSGHANFLAGIKPYSNVNAGRFKKPIKYLNPDLTTFEDFEPPKGVKLPGINKAGSRSTKNVSGKKIQEIEKYYKKLVNEITTGEKPETKKDADIPRVVERPVNYDVEGEPIKASDMFVSNAIPGSPMVMSARSSIASADSIYEAPVDAEPTGRWSVAPTRRPGNLGGGMFGLNPEDQLYGMVRNDSGLSTSRGSSRNSSRNSSISEDGMVPSSPRISLRDARFYADMS